MDRILAVDDNQVNLRVVSAALALGGYEVHTAVNGVDALTLAEQIRPDLILLDITMPEMDGYEVCRRLRSRPATAGVPVMILTAHDTLEEKIKGFEAGADDYLTTPFQRAELLARVKVLLKRRAPTPSIERSVRGRTVGVISLRGGVGVSTLSANLAAALAGLWKQPTLLVDMALHMGQAALMLNLPLRRTWADLAGIPVGEIDLEVVQRVLLKHDKGIYVLAGPHSYSEGESVPVEVVRRALDLLCGRYPYTVLDFPHDLSENTLAGVDRCDLLVVLMSPELASVRATASLFEMLDGIKIKREQIRLVINWTFERKGLARKDIENVLKQPVTAVIPYAPETFVPAINLGIPPVISMAEGPVAGLLEDFAYSLSREEDQRVPPESPSPAWLRVSGRLHLRTAAQS